MQRNKIKDSRMLKMVNEGVSQADIARKFSVTPAAVSKRLREIRGRTTYAVATAKVERAVESKLDAVEQLKVINTRAHELLEQAEDDAHLSVKLMAEIRNQLRLQLDIFETLYSLQGAAEFQESVLETLEEVEPAIRKMVITRLNEKSALRSALRFK